MYLFYSFFLSLILFSLLFSLFSLSFSVSSSLWVVLRAPLYTPCSIPLVKPWYHSRSVIPSFPSTNATWLMEISDSRRGWLLGQVILWFIVYACYFLLPSSPFSPKVHAPVFKSQSKFWIQICSCSNLGLLSLLPACASHSSSSIQHYSPSAPGRSPLLALLATACSWRAPISISPDCPSGWPSPPHRHSPL